MFLSKLLEGYILFEDVLFLNKKLIENLEFNRNIIYIYGKSKFVSFLWLFIKDGVGCISFKYISMDACWIRILECLVNYWVLI